MNVIVSGVQPTGNLHIGNYFGSIRQWIDLQNNSNNECYFFIANLHSITIYQKPDALLESSYKMIAMLIACGVDYQKSSLFVQSTISAHSEMAWIANCITPIGWLNRMIQFKEKAGKNKEKVSSGLYLYPNLQTADILLYDANFVPVGEDQKQHIELTRDVALKFNREYQTELFTVPEPMIIKDTSRIMSLKDPSSKMSKSDPSVFSTLFLTDSNEELAKKIKKATTDSMPIPLSIKELESRDGARNLLNIYSLFANKNLSDVLIEYEGQGFSKLKNNLTELTIDFIEPIRKNFNDLLSNKDYLLQIIKASSQKANKVAQKKIERVKKVIGLI